MKILIATLVAFSISIPVLAKDYSPQECPVVGNTKTHIFHVAGGKHYAKMLRKNKKGDNRKCFKTDAEAQAAGYRKSKT